MAVHVGSSSEWRSILQSTIVVADFYADWCGPCKMIAPTFESLATKHTKPKRVAFAKIDVDKLRDVSSQYGVRAMPTFIIFKNGTPLETIQGANPPKLTAAVENAVKLAGPSASSGFSAPGRTLGGSEAASARGPQRSLNWDLNGFVNAVICFFGLYLASLFSLDPYKAAEASKFNVHNPIAAPITHSGPGETGGAKKPAARTAFRTLADLGGE